MNTSSIVVVGSSNTDMVIKAAHLPQPGETILGGTFFMNAGGKGANQAVAAARLGGRVTFLARTGNDIFGNQAVELLKTEGIDCSFVIRDALHPSGVALITVDDNGENCIVVAPGANAALDPADINAAGPVLKNASLLLMQLETPLDTIERAALLARSAGVLTILNPAPAQALSTRLLASISVITPNQKEAEKLTGITVNNEATAKKAAAVLLDHGIDTVIITMGAAGAFVMNSQKAFMVPGYKVKVADTTAAGDIFNGALAVAISEGKELETAVNFANRAAAISVTRLGAQAAAPYRNEVESFDLAFV